MAEGFPLIYFFLVVSEIFLAFIGQNLYRIFLLFISCLDIVFAFNCVFCLYTFQAELHSFHILPVINMVSFHFPITNEDMKKTT